MTLMLDGIWKRRPALVLLAAATSAFWLASFAATYLLSLKHLNANPNLNAMWEAGFLSFPPKSVTDLRQYVVVVLGVFEAPYQNMQLEESLAGRMGLITATAFVAGILVLLRRDDRGLAGLLMGPLAFAVLAAILHKYPLALPPCSLHHGPDTVGKRNRAGTPDSFTRPVGPGRGPRLARRPPPATRDAGRQVPGRVATQLRRRTVLEHVAREWQAGDLSLIDGCSGPPFLWYQKYGRVPGLDRIEPTVWRTALNDPVRLAPSLPALQGRPRVWLLISDHSRDDREVQLVTLTLDQWGKHIDTAAAAGYYAQLYDFRSTRISLVGRSSPTRE